jgi:hypothetical protein
MWTVVRPTANAHDSFVVTISGITNGDLKNRMESVEGDIVAASEEFEEAVDRTSLHAFPQTNGVAGIVTTDEMVNLYDRRFAKRGSSGRFIYDALRSAPRSARCPLCGFGTVWTVDHHLCMRRCPKMIGFAAADLLFDRHAILLASFLSSAISRIPAQCEWRPLSPCRLV